MYFKNNANIAITCNIAIIHNIAITAVRVTAEQNVSPCTITEPHSIKKINLHLTYYTMLSSLIKLMCISYFTLIFGK